MESFPTEIWCPFWMETINQEEGCMGRGQEAKCRAQAALLDLEAQPRAKWGMGAGEGKSGLIMREERKMEVLGRQEKQQGIKLT
jgi:hypothetical protein